MSITTDINIHGIKKIDAHSPATLGAPLILSLTGHVFPACGSITIFMQDQDLVDRLVTAINNVFAEALPLPTVDEEAAYVAADHAYDADREDRMFRR